MSNEQSVAGGIGLGGAFALLFTYLKLTDVIDWSWWWVLAPIWIPLAIFLSITVGIALTVWVFCAVISENNKK